MNDTQITLTGWVGTDVTLRQVGESQHVASFRVASTPSRFRDGEWVKGTTSWHTVKAWNRLALHVAGSIRSGDPVVIQGRLVADVWEREGTSTTSYEIVASAVGHDLTHGTSAFTRPESSQQSDQPRQQEDVVPTVEEPRAA